jgi:type VI secretion system protein ImpH
MSMQAEGLAPMDPLAATEARGDDALAPLSRLRADPQAFGFFQAVRLLYSAHGFDARGSAARPGPVRFATPATLNFPTSELAWLAEDATGSWRMGVNFLGLTGPLGVLPRHYTEHVIALGRDKATQDFLDLFNHRMLALFWQAWGKHRPEIGREFGLRNTPLRYVHHLVGLGTPALQARLAPKENAAASTQARLPGAAAAYFSGLISQRPHGAAALSQVIAACVGAPVQVDSCVGTWQPVPTHDRTRLGQQAHGLGAAVLGQRFWDRQTTLRLRIGPLDRDTFARLLPRGPLLGDVVELARFLTGLALDLRIVLVLRAGHTPPLPLGAHGPARAQLGWNTWLSGRPAARAANESQFHFSAMGVPSWR